MDCHGLRTVYACEAARTTSPLNGTVQSYGQPFLLLGNLVTLQALCILANLASPSPLVLHILPMGPGKSSPVIDRQEF